MVLNKILEGEVVLLKDLVNLNLQKYIFNICKSELAYTFSPTSKPPPQLALLNENVNHNIYDDFFMHCTLKNNSSTSNYLNYNPVNLDIGHSLFTPLYLLFSYLDIQVKYSNIVRCKVNYQIPSPKNPNPLFHNTPHIDFFYSNKPSFTVIYYVNDSDGDSVFFNKDLTIKQRISPQKGNIAIFNSNLPHSSSHPIKDHRYIISYSFSLK